MHSIKAIWNFRDAYCYQFAMSCQLYVWYIKLCHFHYQIQFEVSLK